MSPPKFIRNLLEADMSMLIIQTSEYELIIPSKKTIPLEIVN